MYTFFAHSVLFKLASPQASQSIFKRKVSKRCTSKRDLIKDAPLIDSKRKESGTQRNRIRIVGTRRRRSTAGAATTAVFVHMENKFPIDTLQMFSG